MADGIYTGLPGGTGSIDDSTTSSTKTWSSNKINTELDLKSDKPVTWQEDEIASFTLTGELQSTGRKVNEFASVGHGHQSTDIAIDTTNFGGNLEVTDNTMQKVADRIDDMGAIGPEGPTGPTGATGAQGDQGFSTLSGIVAPTTEGVNGDTYINTATGLTYKKAAGIWTLDGGSLTGPQGTQGIQGPVGSTGPIGATGAKGDTGSQGVQGIQGIQGPAGQDGLMNSVVAGDNISVDATDPSNPIVGVDVNMTNINSIGYNLAPTGVPTTAGTSYWNPTLKAVETITGIGPILTNGQEFFLYATNDTGVQIDNGKPVILSGSDGIYPTIALGDADNVSATDVIGVTTMDIPNGTQGFVTITGTIRGLDTSSWAQGTILYLDTVAGGFTDVEPIYPAHTVVIGRVQISDAVNGEIYVKTYDVPLASEVKMARTGGSTYSTVQDMNDIFHSAGLVEGGEGTDAGGALLNIAAGNGFIRQSDSRAALLFFCNWDALNGTAIPLGTTRYFGVEWNGTIAQPVVKTSNTWNWNTEWFLGSVSNDGGTLHVSNNPTQVGDHALQMIRRLNGVTGIQRDKSVGGLIATETGTRNISVSAGMLWASLNDFNIPALDTSITGTFDKYLGSAFDASATQWDNLNYNLVGVKTALGSNKWANFWLYAETDGNIVYVYGTQEFTNQALANAASIPTTIPDRIQNSGIIIARGTFQQGSGTATITPLFGVNLSGSVVTDHNSLANLQLAGAGVTYGHIDAGAQTIAGVKTFSSSPIVPAPTTDLQAATKKYVDDNAVTSLDDSAITAAASATNYTPSASNVEGHLAGIDTALGAGGSASLSSVFTAGETIAVGDALYLDSTNGKVYLTDPLDAEKVTYFGTAMSAGVLDDTITVLYDGVENLQSGMTTSAVQYLTFPTAETLGASTSQAGSTNSQDFGQDTTDDNGWGQTFSSSGQLFKIKTVMFRIMKVGAPSDNLVAKLYSAVGGTLLATSATLAGSGAGAFPGIDMTFTFSGDYEAGTSFFVTVSRSGANDASNYYVGWYNISNTYSGNAYRLSSGSWVALPSGRDARFTVEYDYQSFTTTTKGHIGETAYNDKYIVGTAYSATEMLIKTAVNKLLGDTSTTATTGAVVLGNAVGYTTVNLNGTDVKIPYYSV